MARPTKRFSAAAIKQWRISQNLTQADVAKMVDCHPQTVYNWEQGKTRVPVSVTYQLRHAQKS